MDTFHEVLPGNSVFSNFYYIGTKEIRYLNQTIEFSIKSYINMEILSSGIQTLYKTSRDQAVCEFIHSEFFFKTNPSKLGSQVLTLQIIQYLLLHLVASWYLSTYEHLKIKKKVSIFVQCILHLDPFSTNLL